MKKMSLVLLRPSCPLHAGVPAWALLLIQNASTCGHIIELVKGATVLNALTSGLSSTCGRSCIWTSPTCGHQCGWALTLLDYDVDKRRH